MASPAEFRAFLDVSPRRRDRPRADSLSGWRIWSPRTFSVSPITSPSWPASRQTAEQPASSQGRLLQSFTVVIAMPSTGMHAFNVTMIITMAMMATSL